LAAAVQPLAVPQPEHTLCRLELRAVLVDERLEDALDVRADRRRVGGSIRATRLGGGGPVDERDDERERGEPAQDGLLAA
jgi:hypothetical protein